MFTYGGGTYSPNNYKHDYRGLVTVRDAVQHSLNLATMRVAERIGYSRIAALAKRLGLNAKIKGYPSLAIGGFEVTPIELAGAYTAFANEGKRSEPHALLRVVGADGKELKAYKYEPRQVLRPEVAHLMTGPARAFAHGDSSCRPLERRVRRAMAGLPATPRICS